MSEIINFYNFQPNKDGTTLNSIWDMSFEELDKCHNFIQYLFPTQEVSQFHPEAPLLTEEDIKEFKENCVIRANLLFSLNLMLEFFGLKRTYRYYNGDSTAWIVEKADDYNERKSVWQGKMNHNYLRITRILTCLRLCGLKKEAEAFLDCLFRLALEKAFGIDMDFFVPVAYWNNAVYPVK